MEAKDRYNGESFTVKVTVMPKKLFLAGLALCLCFSAAGCGDHASPAADDATVPPVAQVSAETTLPPETTVPETTSPEAAVPETAAAETEPAQTEMLPATEETVWDDSDPGNPLLSPPEASEGPCHFYDDAAFIGDSISYNLMLHHTKTGDFGDALFLVRGSLGVHNILNKVLTVYYQGQYMPPWDALKASQVNKVFIMLGTNDIGYYGIDETMVKWEEFLGKIREACPDIQIYIQALTPMWHGGEKGALNNQNIDVYNERLEEFAETNGCFYVNVTDYLKDHHNSLAEVYSNDYYVHMNYDGTEVWADALKNYGAQQEKETN